MRYQNDAATSGEQNSTVACKSTLALYIVSAAGRNLREDNAAYYRVVGEAIHWMGLVIAKGFSWSEIADYRGGIWPQNLLSIRLEYREGGGCVHTVTSVAYEYIYFNLKYLSERRQLISVKKNLIL